MKHLEVFLTALKLGFTSFGGPVAHLSFFHDEYVKKKKWMSEHAYADLVALCQFLPGPASSQVGMAIGLSRAGILGSFLSWLGFTLPSALILIVFALSLSHLEPSSLESWIHGLKIVAVSVVAQAVLGMSRKLCPDYQRKAIALISAVIILVTNSVFIQVFVLIAAAVIGALFLTNKNELPHEPLHRGNSKRGAFFLALFLGLLITLPLMRPLLQNWGLDLFDSFYRAGALVFGGGHVVLPLLQVELVPSGLVDKDLFMAGYGAANAIPGPLFAFSAYLGAVSQSGVNAWLGALICLVAAFLPSFLLVNGALPFWEKLRTIPNVRKSMLGLNASVVGILLAALYNPVWTSAIFSFQDFLLALLGFILLEFRKLPSWLVVLIIFTGSLVLEVTNL